MGCYEQSRFPSREAMIEEIMAIYRVRPELRLPAEAEL
jgi:2,4-dienoyl-CoA reductase (NADPH2)